MQIAILLLLVVIILLLININFKIPKRDYVKEEVERALERDGERKKQLTP